MPTNQKKSVLDDSDPSGYLLHGSERVVQMFLTDEEIAAKWLVRGEKVEEVFTAAQVAAMRANDLARIAELEEAIDNASMAASETHPSWKDRCYRIMGALGLDYGDPDWLMPGERRRLEAAIARIADLENQFGVKSLPQGEVERLLDAEQELVGHHIEYYPFSEKIWRVRSNDTAARRGSLLSIHSTRWEAIAAAEVADRAAKGD